MVLTIIFSQGMGSRLTGTQYTLAVRGDWHWRFATHLPDGQELSEGTQDREAPTNDSTQRSALGQLLLHFSASELDGQPLPNKDRTDDRFELLRKLQGVLQSLRFRALCLVDRIDEPHLINGRADLMKGVSLAIADNKLP